MSTVFVFLAEGFEEIETATIVDLLRRVEVDCRLVSVTGNRKVQGANHMYFYADELFQDVDIVEANCVVLPGGMPGAENLLAHEGVRKAVLAFHKAGKYIAAICAAPMVLGNLGVTIGKQAAIYPGMEKKLQGAYVQEKAVCQDGHIITSRGPATAIPFALQLVRLLAGRMEMERIQRDILYLPCILLANGELIADR